VRDRSERSIVLLCFGGTIRDLMRNIWVISVCLKNSIWQSAQRWTIRDNISRFDLLRHIQCSEVRTYYVLKTHLPYAAFSMWKHRCRACYSYALLVMLATEYLSSNLAFEHCENLAYSPGCATQTASRTTCLNTWCKSSNISTGAKKLSVGEIMTLR